MNRFDRVVSIFLLLQTRSVVTAKFLSEQFEVSERTIYRDIRTLENAGIPIGSEAGVGYFLERGYHLPPVSFTLDEAASILLGEKLLVSSLDANSRQDFKQALNKIKAVVDTTDKDYLASLDADSAALPTGSQFPNERPNSQSEDRWLRECRRALLHRNLVEIDYLAVNSEQPTSRQIEPIGLYYYGWHWHLIGWCRLREGYRDFRLDRITSFVPQAEQFPRHSRLTLQQYLDEQPDKEGLQEVELLFDSASARYVQEQRYMFGFIDEEQVAEGVKMRFLTHVPDYMARWLLQYTDGVKVLKGEAMKTSLQQLSQQLFAHWGE